jgi:hypothetical protein
MGAINVVTGDTLSVTVEFLEADNTTPRSTQGSTVRCAILNKQTKAIKELGIVELDSTQGVYHISASPQQTSTWAVGEWELEIELTTPNGVVTSSKRISFTVLGGIVK